jgi:hypothetical protein
LHFRYFLTFPLIPILLNNASKNSVMSTVFPSCDDPESAMDCISMSKGVPSSLSVSESVHTPDLYGFLADGFVSGHTTTN